MEEPKKILRAQYLGSTQVCQATGMDTLNDAIELLSASLETWQQVNVAVAPSMISILHPGVSFVPGGSSELFQKPRKRIQFHVFILG